LYLFRRQQQYQSIGIHAARINLRGQLVQGKILVSQESEVGNICFPCLVYYLKITFPENIVT